MPVEYEGEVGTTCYVVVRKVEQVFREKAFGQAVEIAENEDDSEVLPITLRFVDLPFAREFKDLCKKSDTCSILSDGCRKFWVVVHADAPGRPYSPPDDPNRFFVFSSRERAEEQYPPGGDLQARPVVLLQANQRTLRTTDLKPAHPVGAYASVTRAISATFKRIKNLFR